MIFSYHLLFPNMHCKFFNFPIYFLTEFSLPYFWISLHLFLCIYLCSQHFPSQFSQTIFTYPSDTYFATSGPLSPEHAPCCHSIIQKMLTLGYHVSPSLVPFQWAVVIGPVSWYQVQFRKSIKLTHSCFS